MLLEDNQEDGRKKRKKQMNIEYSVMLGPLVAQKALLVGGAIVLLQKRVHLLLVNPQYSFCDVVQ